MKWQAHEFELSTRIACNISFPSAEPVLDEMRAVPVARGKRFITTCVAELLANELERDSDLPPHHALSDREFPTVRPLASGKSVSEIATSLTLCVKTASTYRTLVLEK